MSENVNNGFRTTILVQGEEVVAGVVDRDGYTSISYAPRSTLRPTVGGHVIVGGVERLVLSVEVSKYVPSLLVVNVE